MNTIAPASTGDDLFGDVAIDTVSVGSTSVGLSAVVGSSVALESGLFEANSALSLAHSGSQTADPPVPRQVTLLDSHTVNQIAAGEVVERPASVVKELIENALDAGARRIVVTVEDAGRRLIRVADDGSGMDDGNARTALLRHATSKILSADDLLRVGSYGFRGEAIPSVASVSRLTLSTGTGQGARTVLVVDCGQIVSESAEAGPRGTTVTVEDLFGSVPARLKFLKSDTTEIGACVEAVTRAALANPSVSIVMRTGSRAKSALRGQSDAGKGESGSGAFSGLGGDGGFGVGAAFPAGSLAGSPAGSRADLIRTSGSGDLVTTVSELWGRDVARALVPIDVYNGHVRCWGLVSPPHFTKPTRAMQWLFVNGRPVRNKTITAGLDQAMRSLTPERRYPVAILLVEIASDKVDVNVSPSKTEVKFHQEGLVFDAVRRSVREALLASGMVPSLTDIALANHALGAPIDAAAGQGSFQGSFHGLGSAGSQTAFVAPYSPTGVGGHRAVTGYGFVQGSPMPGAGNAVDPGPGAMRVPDSYDPFDESPVSSGPALSAQHDGSQESLTPPQNLATRSLPAYGSHAEQFLDGLRVLGQVDNVFIIAENRSGLLVIDQHVAHERVLYEQLRATRGSGAVEVQHLLVPETLHLDRRAATALADRLDDLAAVGFLIEPFGGDSFLVRGLPAAGRGKAPLEVLKDLIDEIADGRPGEFRAGRDDVLIMCSCKMAIKAGDPIGYPEMVKLLEDLAYTENPYLCPHGRPITLVMPKSDLLRKFHR